MNLFLRRRARSPFALLLVFFLPATSMARQPLRQTSPARPDSYAEEVPLAGPSQEPETQAGPLTRVDPKLVHKKVVVRLHDGRTYQGRLIQYDQEFIELEVKRQWDTIQRKAVVRTERIPLAQIAFIERQPSRKWLGIGIAAGAADTFLVLLLIAASSD